MPLRGETSIQLARYWPGALLTECGPYLFELHLPKAECSIKTDEGPISCGGFMLFLKKTPRAIFKMLTGAMCYWLIPSRPEAVLPVLAPRAPSWSPVGVCHALKDGSSLMSCTLTQVMVTLPPSPCVWTFSEGSQVHSPAYVRWVAAQVPAWSLHEGIPQGWKLKLSATTLNSW